MSISLERTQDILAYLGEHRREGQFICGFSMETENMIENSRAKLGKKNVDIITYKKSTGLECLIGYLKINNNIDRINEIMNYIVRDNDESNG